MAFEEESEVDRTASDRVRKVFRASQEESDEHTRENRRELFSLGD
jgi:hypothetical protein